MVSMKEETKMTIYSASNNPEMDEACKALFQNKEIIAPIIQKTVSEFENLSVEEIMKLIDVDTIREDMPVSDLPLLVEGINTELSAIREKTIFFDVHFKAINPKLSNEIITINLHIDIESQNEYFPGYPIIKRAWYYAARDLASQLSVLTEETDYAKLEKCYSIWICNHDVPKNLQNTISRYRIKREDIFASIEEPEENYDLMEVIMIRRDGNNTDYEENSVLDYLQQVFTSNIEGMNRFIDVNRNEKIRKDVERMTGLSNVYYQDGLAKGLSQGLSQGLTQGLLQGLVKYIKALKENSAKYPDYASVYKKVREDESFSVFSDEQIEDIYNTN